MNNLYEHYKQYEVRADSVEDFMMKYTKHERHYGRGEEYAQARIKSYKEEFANDGFTMMSKFESITGKPVSYYGNK